MFLPNLIFQTTIPLFPVTYNLYPSSSLNIWSLRDHINYLAKTALKNLEVFHRFREYNAPMQLLFMYRDLIRPWIAYDFHNSFTFHNSPAWAE